jgi:hypothetical protein
MKKHIPILATILFLIANSGISQNLDYTKEVLFKLCSPELFGRGYVNKGDSLAADYIASQMGRWGLKSFGENYYQYHTLPVNSQPKADVWIDGKKMPSDGYLLVEASSPSLKGTFPLVNFDARTLKNPRRFMDAMASCNGAFIMIDSAGIGNEELYNFAKGILYSDKLGQKGIIEVTYRLPFGVPRANFDSYVKVQMHESLKPENPESITIDNVNIFIPDYQTQNVIGYVSGKTDQWIVFTGHYDGMGMYGDVHFPGANDNGSGTSMVMDLARHFATGKTPHYSYAFMLFPGEERGLWGSRYYADHPLFPMEKIRMVINLDMVCTGQNGFQLFNAETWPMEANIIETLNTNKNYLPSMRWRGPAANSDHHPFHVKGVPAIFFITSGKAGPGHTAFDFPQDALWPEYNDLFNLITDFIDILKDTPDPVGYPLTDYHIHLKGDMTLEKAIEKSKESGIKYGVALNCGVGFPVNSDEEALKWLESMEDTPFLLGMQAEGREWVNTFSKDVINKFDYVFTDAMTYTNENGERMRLWMPDEVSVGDKQAFMDDLVNRIVKIISEEPIDIYVNPTFLPEVIADEYDELWTEERMDKVIRAARKNKVAIEINNHYKLPSPAFIKRARDAGVKFAFGTNNTDSNTGDLDWCRKMIGECLLVKDDMWRVN